MRWKRVYLCDYVLDNLSSCSLIRFVSKLNVVVTPIVSKCFPVRRLPIDVIVSYLIVIALKPQHPWLMHCPSKQNCESWIRAIIGAVECLAKSKVEHQHLSTTASISIRDESPEKGKDEEKSNQRPPIELEEEPILLQRKFRSSSISPSETPPMEIESPNEPCSVWTTRSRIPPSPRGLRHEAKRTWRQPSYKICMGR